MPSERAKQSVTISREAWDFLCGVGSLEGQQFGDDHPTRAGHYWWRSAIRETSLSYDTELPAIKADMAEIDRLCAEEFHTFVRHSSIPAIAARYRDVDPLQEALRHAFGAAAPEFVEATRKHLADAGYAVVELGKGS